MVGAKDDQTRECSSDRAMYENAQFLSLTESFFIFCSERNCRYLDYALEFRLNIVRCPLSSSPRGIILISIDWFRVWHHDLQTRISNVFKVQFVCFKNSGLCIKIPIHSWPAAIWNLCNAFSSMILYSNRRINFY